MLDTEVFRCKDPEFETKPIDNEEGFVVRVAFIGEWAESAKDADTEGEVPAEVPDRIDIASSASTIRL